jgi:hypothetical protein
VAFHPVKKQLVHVETSMDAEGWEQRETKFSQEFTVGEKYIPGLFAGLEPLPHIEYVALIGIGSAKKHATVGGGKVQTVCDLLREIRETIPHEFSSQAVPEQYVILRTLQFAAGLLLTLPREQVTTLFIWPSERVRENVVNPPAQTASRPALANNARTGHPQFQNRKRKNRSESMGHPPWPSTKEVNPSKCVHPRKCQHQKLPEK